MNWRKAFVILLVVALLPMGAAFAQADFGQATSRSSNAEILTKASQAYLEKVQEADLASNLKLLEKSLPEPDATPAAIEETSAPVGNFPADSSGKVTVIIDMPGDALANQIKQLGLNYGGSDSESSLSLLRKSHEAALAGLDAAGLSYTALFHYYVAYNGMALVIDKSELPVIQGIFGIDAVHSSKTFYADLEFSVPLTGAANVWVDPGVKGEGMVLGVVDTGVDYNHPDLGGPGFPNAKIVNGYDFGDMDPDPMDLNGHGTHVSGTMTASAASPAGVTGMAPESQLLIAKIVHGGTGSASSETIAAAFDWMLIQKLSGYNLAAINMSFGSPGGWKSSTDPEQVAIQSCVDNGIFVSLSAGNNYYGFYPYAQVNWYGEDPNKLTYFPADIGIVGGPSVTSGAMSTAASWNSSSRYVSFLVNDGSSTRGAYTSSSAVDPVTRFGLTPQNFVYVSYGNDDTYYDGKDVTGKIALILRGGPGVADFTNKLARAKAHGAAGSLVMNDAARGDALLSMVTPAGYDIPALFTGYTAGTYLVNHPAAQVVFDGQTVPVPNATVDTICDFSSWGTDNNLYFKPEITAPGGGIWSTVPLVQGGYANYSGTSMAAPHVGGAATLIKQAHPLWTPEQIKAALMNTAKLEVYPATTRYFSPRQQGAGRIQVDKALKTPVFVTDPLTGLAAVPLGDTNNATIKSFQLKAVNLTPLAVGYNLSGVLQRYNNARAPLALTGATISMPAAITVPAGGQLTFTVTIDVSGNAVYENIFVDGFVILTPTDPTFPVLHVPYTLFWGDWQDTRYTADWIHNPVIDQPPDDPAGWWVWGYTWLWWKEGSTFHRLGVDFSDNLQRGLIAISPNGDGIQDNLQSLISFMRGAKDLTISLHTRTGDLVTLLSHDRYINKNTSGYPFWSEWDNSWLWSPESGSVLDGSYLARFKAEIPATLDGPAGGFETVELPFIIDTVNPVVNILSVQNTGSVQANWAGTDERSGVWGYAVFADGELVGMTPPTANSLEIPFNPASIAVVAYDNAGNMGISSVPCVTFDLMPGWNLVTPGLSTSKTPAELFGAGFSSCLRWNPATRLYENVSAMSPGMGDWVKMNASKFVSITGSYTAAPLTVVLPKGYSQIGNPFEFGNPWANVTITNGGITKTLPDAKTARWITPAFSQNGSVYAIVNFASDLMNPGQGYWLQALVPGCTVNFNP